MGEKCWCQWNSKGVFICYICFFCLLWVYNCAKFHNYRICVTDFREGAFLYHASVSSPEKAHLKKLKNNYVLSHLFSGEGLEIIWKFDLFKNSKMCILCKQSFQLWQIFLALTVNCKGQQNCSHTMECNSNGKQVKLYLHKAVIRVLEGCF